MADWIYPLLAAEEQQQVATALALFEASQPDGKQLREAAKSLENLEKRLNLERSGAGHLPELTGGLLVCTVGLRPMPVILTTLMLRPTKLYLLHSAESRRVAEQIRDDPYVQKLALHPVNDIVLSEISLSNAPLNYDVLRRIVDSNPQQKIVVDISGGVKVMGTSLATAAFWLRLPVIYQFGEEVQGVIRPFSEQLLPLVNPFVHFGSTDLRSISELFHSGNYDAALTLTDNLREMVGDVTTLGRLEVLSQFVRIYRDWDAFRHSALEDSQERRLASRLQAVHERLRRMGLHFAEPRVIEANLAFLQLLEDSWKQGRRSMNDHYRLVDIYAASKRRAAAGKYDDAIGRLYRCLEMSASLALATHCEVLDVEKPDFGFFTRILGSREALEKRFVQVAKYPFPDERKLGLEDQMVLLALSDNKNLQTIAGIYNGMKGKQLMEKRNRSILAHGTVSVTQEEYRQYDEGARDIVSRTVGTPDAFRQLIAQATHPSISIEL